MTPVERAELRLERARADELAAWRSIYPGERWRYRFRAEVGDMRVFTIRSFDGVCITTVDGRRHGIDNFLNALEHFPYPHENTPTFTDKDDT
jgi:hypothetical protein